MTISGILFHICLVVDAGEPDRFPGPQRSYHLIPNRHLGQDSSFLVLAALLQSFLLLDLEYWRRWRDPCNTVGENIHQVTCLPPNRESGAGTMNFLNPGQLVTKKERKKLGRKSNFHQPRWQGQGLAEVALLAGTWEVEPMPRYVRSRYTAT